MLGVAERLAALQFLALPRARVQGFQGFFQPGSDRPAQLQRLLNPPFISREKTLPLPHLLHHTHHTRAP